MNYTMYITNFSCTYKLHDDDDQEDIYRAQFLQVFNLTKWDDNMINIETDKLYKLCRQKKEFPVLVNKLKQSSEIKTLLSIMGEGDDILFKCLFRFEVFDVAHKYFCNVIENKAFDEEIFSHLLNNIK